VITGRSAGRRERLADRRVVGQVVEQREVRG
jgi:hypothetical protein